MQSIYHFYTLSRLQSNENGTNQTQIPLTQWCVCHSPGWTYGLVQGEAVVDAGGQRDQVPLPHGDPDPPVVSAPDIKVRLAVHDVADLVVQVEVLLEEGLQLSEERERDYLRGGETDSTSCFLIAPCKSELI